MSPSATSRSISTRASPAARAGRVEVTVAGGHVTGRSARDLGEQLRAGEARITTVLTTVRGSEIGSTPSVLGQHHSVVVPVSWAGSPQPPTNGAAGAGFVATYWAGNTENEVRNTIDKVYPTTKITPSAETIATCDHRALMAASVTRWNTAPPPDGTTGSTTTSSSCPPGGVMGATFGRTR